MTSIPTGTTTGTTSDPTGGPPALALRVVSSHEGRTRRVDVAVAGSTSYAVEGGVTTPFATEQLWPVVRELLPPLDLLRADPQGRGPLPPRAPDPALLETCRTHVAIATLLGPTGPTGPTGPDTPDTPDGEQRVVMRTWFATDDELWSASPQPDGTTEVRAEPAGALADVLVWDVTGALDALLSLLQDAS